VREDVRGVRGLVALLPFLAIAGCATGAKVLGGNGLDGGTGGSVPDAGPMDAGSDAGQVVGDALPPSAVSFFLGTGCPTGWVPYMAGDGRFLVPTVATFPAGLTTGTPLMSGEDRTHTHSVSATWSLGSTSYVGVSGGGNGGVTSAGNVMMTTQSDAASTGLPYIQLLACRKNAPAVPGSAPLPKGLQMFFDMAACPPGWLQTSATQGRFIVGLPESAPQDVTFGGPALSTADGGVDGGSDVRTHTHPDTATLTTTSHGIALASGCCGGGYGANGTYTSTMDTAASDPGLPTLAILGCEKQ
jgi:hypothetical protein